MFLFWQKIWKLHEVNVRRDFSSYIKNFKESSEAGASIEGFWEVLKGTLLRTKDGAYG